MMYFDRHGLFTEKHAAALIRHMMLAVKQCHDNNVIHREYVSGASIPYQSHIDVMQQIARCFSPQHQTGKLPYPL
jgi:serine/threonine protein kinase